LLIQKERFFYKNNIFLSYLCGVNIKNDLRKPFIIPNGLVVTTVWAHCTRTLCVRHDIQIGRTHSVRVPTRCNNTLHISYFIFATSYFLFPI
jgi:hypothetical protein